MIKRMLTTVGVLALIAGLVAVASPANAKPKKPRDKANVSVSFDPLSQEYTGTVKSTKRCQSFRRVTVLEQPGGLPDSETPPPTAVGTDRTNGKGQFKVNAAGVPDIGTEYFARVKSEKRKRSNCLSDVSPTETYLGLP